MARPQRHRKLTWRNRRANHGRKPSCGKPKTTFDPSGKELKSS